MVFISPTCPRWLQWAELISSQATYFNLAALFDQNRLSGLGGESYKYCYCFGLSQNESKNFLSLPSKYYYGYNTTTTIVINDRKILRREESQRRGGRSKLRSSSRFLPASLSLTFDFSFFLQLFLSLSSQLVSRVKKTLASGGAVVREFGLFALRDEFRLFVLASVDCQKWSHNQIR